MKNWIRHNRFLTFFIILLVIGGFAALLSKDSTNTTTAKVEQGSCVGPDGKRISLSGKACEEFNNAWKNKQQTQQAAANTPATSTVAKPTVQAVPHFKDGTHQVGKDIQAGTYRTRTDSSGCYFARLSGFSGDLEEILHNDNTNAPAVVTIETTDKGFESRHCGTWTQDLSPITKSRTSFGDGTFIVGTDIDAGTYKSSGGSGCYYARLAAFTGGVESILANNNTDSTAVVTIASTDKGFQSRRCGTWKQIE